MLDGSAKKLSLRFAVGSEGGTLPARSVFVDGPTQTVWVATDGHDVVTWRVEPGTAALRQCSVMTTRSGCGTALVCKIGAGEEESATVVLGRDRSLSVWESDLCVGKKSAATTGRPERACLLSDGLHVAVAGRGCEVEVVSVGLLAVTQTLPHGHASWITALHALPPLGSNRLERRPPVLFSASRDGMAVFWSLDLAAGTAIPVASLALDPSAPALAARVSADAKVLAMVFATRVELHRTLKPALLHALPAPPGRQWRGCCFLSPLRLLVWDDAGGAVVFLLPLSYRQLPEPQFGPSSVAPQQNESFGRRRPFETGKSKSKSGSAVSAGTSSSSSRGGFHRSRTGIIFQERDPSEESPPSATMAAGAAETDPSAVEAACAALTEPMVEQRLAVPAETEEGEVWQWVDSACSAELYCAMGANGRLHAWLLREGEADELRPLYCPSPPAVAAAPEPAMQSVVVLIDETSAVLVEGCASGELRGTSLPSGRLLWRQPRAHTGSVTCLFCPPTEDAPPGVAGSLSAARDQFVSGGADYRVVVWHAQTGAQMHVFAQHAGRVERIVGPPATGTRWRSCLLSVGSDRAVCLLSLQNYNCQYMLVGHSARVESLVWREDQDFLIVGCADGSAYVWELGTGSLVQHGRSPRAQEVIFEGWFLIQTVFPHSHVFKVLSSGPNLLSSCGRASRRGGGLVSARSHGERAAQVLTVGVRQLLAALAQGGGRAAGVLGWAAWLVPWDALPEATARELAERTSLSPTMAGVCSALQGRGKLVSVSRAPQRRRETSARLAALQLMAAVAVLQRLVRQSEDLAVKSICTQVIGLLCNDGGAAVPPSLAVLATHWQDSQEEVMDAARSLFGATVEHMGAGELRKCIALYENALTEGVTTPRFRSLAAMVLGALAARGVALEVPLTARVTDALVLLVLNAPDRAVSLGAAELLATRGAPLRGGGVEMQQLLERLLRLALAAGPGGAAGEVAWRALLAVAAAQPDAALRLLSASAASPETSVAETNAMLVLLRDLARSSPGCLLPHLGVVAGLAVRPLDPAVAHKRRACLACATQTLDALVRRFPMVAFHQPQQRIAVGTAGAQVLLFDVATGNETARLEGHKGPVAAVAFSPAGTQVAAFCLTQGQIKVAC